MILLEIYNEKTRKDIAYKKFVSFDDCINFIDSTIEESNERLVINIGYSIDDEYFTATFFILRSSNGFYENLSILESNTNRTYYNEEYDILYITHDHYKQIITLRDKLEYKSNYCVIMETI